MVIPNDPPSDATLASRRDFLTGRAAQAELAARGAALADALARPSPAGPAVGDTLRLETRAMGCPWTAILNPGPVQEIEAASAAFELVYALDARWSLYQANTELIQLNARAGEFTRAADDLWELLTRCRTRHAETEGAFDVAVAPLTGLWRDCRQSGRVPTAGEVDRARNSSGMHRIDWADSRRMLRLPPGGGLDLGAVGKGFGVDQAAASLRAAGVESFVLHGGHSSVFASGSHLGQAGWPIGLKNPLFPDRHYATLLLRNEALGTSGSNVQFFRHEGRRYGHLLDPRTGWPAEALLSATVLAATAEEADRLSTAFYVMGLEKATAYCQDHPEVGAILAPAGAVGGRWTPVVLNLSPDRLWFADDAYPPSASAPGAPPTEPAREKDADA